MENSIFCDVFHELPTLWMNVGFHNFFYGVPKSKWLLDFSFDTDLSYISFDRYQRCLNELSPSFSSVSSFLLLKSFSFDPWLLDSSQILSMQSFLFELQQYSSTIAWGSQGIEFLETWFKHRSWRFRRFHKGRCFKELCN